MSRGRVCSALNSREHQQEEPSCRRNLHALVHVHLVSAARGGFLFLAIFCFPVVSCHINVAAAHPAFLPGGTFGAYLKNVPIYCENLILL